MSKFQPGMNVRMSRRWTAEAKRRDYRLVDFALIGEVVTWVDLGEQGGWLELRLPDGSMRGWGAPSVDSTQETTLELA